MNIINKLNDYTGEVRLKEHNSRNAITIKALIYIRKNIKESRQLYYNYGVKFKHGEHYESVDKLILNQIQMNVNSMYLDDEKFCSFRKDVNRIINYLFNEMRFK